MTACVHVLVECMFSWGYLVGTVDRGSHSLPLGGTHPFSATQCRAEGGHSGMCGYDTSCSTLKAFPV